MNGYRGKHGGGATGRYTAPAVAQPTQQSAVSRYGARPASPAAVNVGTQKTNTPTGRYGKTTTVKESTKENIPVLRELALEVVKEIKLTSTLNTLNLLVNTGNELSNCTVTYNEVYSLVGTKEECINQLKLVITHIDKIRIMHNPEFAGELSPFIDKVVSNVINANFKNVRFKDVVKNINILLNLKDRDDVVWQMLIDELNLVINTMTDNTLQIQLKLVITDDETWIKHLADSVVKEIEFDVPLYDNMFYVLMDDKVYRVIGTRMNLIKA